MSERKTVRFGDAILYLANELIDAGLYSSFKDLVEDGIRELYRQNKDIISRYQKVGE